VIGAGIAGLAAAQQMQQFGLEVVVLEARVSFFLKMHLKKLPQNFLSQLSRFSC